LAPVLVENKTGQWFAAGLFVSGNPPEIVEVESGR
jgi:hypothetical protein